MLMTGGLSPAGTERLLRHLLTGCPLVTGADPVTLEPWRVGIKSRLQVSQPIPVDLRLCGYDGTRPLASGEYVQAYGARP